MSVSSSVYTREAPRATCHQIWVWGDRHISLVEMPQGFVLLVQKIGSNVVESIKELAFKRSRTSLVDSFKTINVGLDSAGCSTLIPFKRNWPINIQTEPPLKPHLITVKEERPLYGT